MTKAAVLTGDLVGSTEAGPKAVNIAMASLAMAAEEIAGYSKMAPPRFTRSRGDGWQVIVTPSKNFLRMTTFLLAHLRRADVGLETRIGIGLGEITSVGSNDLADASGSAFIYSGHALEEINASERLAIAGLAEQELIWPKTALETITYLAGRWSTEQAHALLWRLPQKPFPLLKISNELGISRQALSSRLAVAGEKPIMAAIRAVEATL